MCISNFSNCSIGEKYPAKAEEELCGVAQDLPLQPEAARHGKESPDETADYKTRHTFYYHYEDIYDLLSDVLESEIERALSVPAGGASWETMLLDMLSFLIDSPQIGRHIFQSKCQDAMRVYLSKVISELSDRYIEQNVRDLDYSQQDRKLICDICCHALYGLLEEWLTGRSDVALEAELRRVAQLFEGTVRHALEFSAAHPRT